MKKFSKNALFIIGIVCLPIITYKYFTTDGSELKYLIGIFCSICLIYGSSRFGGTHDSEGKKLEVTKKIEN